MLPQFFIYALTDPTTDEVRYVGKSASGMKRPRAHSTSSVLKTESHTHKSRWIQKLLKNGLQPRIEVVEEFGGSSDLVEAERFWISQFRAWGFKLTNHLDGGEGGATRTGQRHSEETRRKMSEAQKGRKYCLGRVLSQETKDKISASRKGKPSPLRGRAGHPNPQQHRGKPFVDFVGVVYRTLNEAHGATGIPKSTIQATLKGVIKTGRFRYLNG